MPVLTYLAIYFITWWTVLFAVLPWGIRSQAESDMVEPGTDPGAPVQPRLLRKALVTTVIAAIVTGAILYIIESGIVSMEDIPMPFDTKSD